MECFGHYNYKDQKCLECSQREACMLKAYNSKLEGLEPYKLPRKPQKPQRPKKKSKKK